jgi:hypothetical protein
VDTLLTRVTAAVYTAWTKLADVAMAGTEVAGSLIRRVYDNLDAAISSRSTYAGGAVASVTGNVGGNVVGSVASVTGAVGSVTAGVTVTTNNDKTGYALSAVGVQAIWDALTSALTTVGSIGKKLADWVVGTIDTYTGNTKQTADHTAAIADIPTVAEFNARSLPSADYTIVADLGTVQTEDHTANIAAIKAITDLLPSGIKKNTALANFEFYMVLAADHISPATGKTIVCQRSIDGGAFANCATVNATEVSDGVYKLNLAASDLNGDVVTFKFSEATCDTRLVTVKTST